LGFRFAILLVLFSFLFFFFGIISAGRHAIAMANDFAVAGVRGLRGRKGVKGFDKSKHKLANRGGTNGTWCKSKVKGHAGRSARNLLQHLPPGPKASLVAHIRFVYL